MNEPKTSTAKGIETLVQIGAILGSLTSVILAAMAIYMFANYEKRQQEQATRQAEIKTVSDALGLGAKSVFNIHTVPTLTISPLVGERFHITWKVPLINRGYHDVQVTQQVLRLYRTEIPEMYTGLFHAPWDRTGIEWQEIGQVIYSSENEKQGLEHVAAIGWMAPGDNRYASLRAFIQAQPTTWIFATAEVVIKREKLESEKQEIDTIDTLVEWDYSQAFQANRPENP